jgi:hypothetical protein
MTDKIQSILEQFSPDLQAVLKDYAKLKVEAKMLDSALKTSQQQYAHLMLFMMAVLRQMPEYELRFKKADLEAYSMFKDSWQVETRYDAGMDEQVLQLVEKGTKSA